MRLNEVMLAAGLFLIGISLHRMGFKLIRLDTRFWWETVPMLVAAGTTILITRRLAGHNVVIRAIGGSAQEMIFWTPMLIGMFIAMGQIGTLTATYSKQIRARLDGPNGVLLSPLAAFMIPGGITGLQSVHDLWLAGAHRAPLVNFMMTCRLVSWPILLLTIPALSFNWRLIAVNGALNFSAAAVITLMVWCIARIFRL